MHNYSSCLYHGFLSFGCIAAAGAKAGYVDFDMINAVIIFGQNQFRRLGERQWRQTSKCSTISTAEMRVQWIFQSSYFKIIGAAGRSDFPNNPALPEKRQNAINGYFINAGFGFQRLADGVYTQRHCCL